jgi:hypothetical protein
VVATQLRGERSARRGERLHARGAVGTPWRAHACAGIGRHAVVSACMRGERSARRGERMHASLSAAARPGRARRRGERMHACIRIGAVVSACMRAFGVPPRSMKRSLKRPIRSGRHTLWVTAVSVRSMSTTDTCQIASRKTGRFS